MTCLNKFLSSFSRLNCGLFDIIINFVHFFVLINDRLLYFFWHFIDGWDKRMNLLHFLGLFLFFFLRNVINFVQNFNCRTSGSSFSWNEKHFLIKKLILTLFFIFRRVVLSCLICNNFSFCTIFVWIWIFETIVAHLILVCQIFSFLIYFLRV